MIKGPFYIQQPKITCSAFIYRQITLLTTCSFMISYVKSDGIFYEIL